MNHLLQKLSPRETWLLVAGVSALLCAGLYSFAYLPLLDEQKKLAVAIDNQQKLAVFLASVSAEAASLRQNQAESPAGSGGQSAMALIETSSTQMAVKTCIQRVVPEDTKNTQVWLEKCSFDQLIEWLAVLQKQNGLSVRQIQLAREVDSAGLVNGKLVLSQSLF